jgi:hypothetical protein
MSQTQNASTANPDTVASLLEQINNLNQNQRVQLVSGLTNSANAFNAACANAKAVAATVIEKEPMATWKKVGIGVAVVGGGAALGYVAYNALKTTVEVAAEAA